MDTLLGLSAGFVDSFAVKKTGYVHRSRSVIIQFWNCGQNPNPIDQIFFFIFSQLFELSVDGFDILTDLFYYFVYFLDTTDRKFIVVIVTLFLIFFRFFGTSVYWVTFFL